MRMRFTPIWGLLFGVFLVWIGVSDWDGIHEPEYPWSPTRLLGRSGTRVLVILVGVGTIVWSVLALAGVRTL